MILDPDALPPDLPFRETAERLRTAYPAAALAGACFGVPIVVASSLVPDALAWLGYGGALAFDGAAALAASRAEAAGRPIPAATRAGVSATARRWRPLLAVYVIGAAFALPIVGSVAFLTGVLGLGLFAVFLTALWAILVIGRGALLIPAVVTRGLGPTDAFDLATSVVDGFVVETAGLLFLGLLIAVGPPFALGVAALVLGWPVLPTAALVGVLLALATPPAAVALGAWLDVLEAHRRLVDPGFGRP